MTSTPFSPSPHPRDPSTAPKSYHCTRVSPSGESDLSARYIAQRINNSFTAKSARTIKAGARIYRIDSSAWEDDRATDFRAASKADPGRLAAVAARRLAFGPQRGQMESIMASMLSTDDRADGATPRPSFERRCNKPRSAINLALGLPSPRLVYQLAGQH